MSQLMGNLSTEREKNEIMQKQLESLSFLDKRKATKPKLLADQVPSVSAVTLVSDQVTAPVQQQISVPSPSKAPPAKVTKRVAPRLGGQECEELCCKIMRMRMTTDKET
eukprot:UN13561